MSKRMVGLSSLCQNTSNLRLPKSIIVSLFLLHFSTYIYNFIYLTKKDIYGFILTPIFILKLHESYSVFVPLGYGLGVIDAINDTARIDYLYGYIGSMLDAIRYNS